MYIYENNEICKQEDKSAMVQSAEMLCNSGGERCSEQFV